MGRLFWKIFLPIWLAQIIGTMSVMLMFKLEGPPAGQHQAPDTALAQASMQTMPRRAPSMLPPEPLVAHLLASLLVASLLAHYFSRPIRSLRDAIRHAAAGNLAAGIDHRVASRNDELSDLLTEFDRMARQLHAVMESQRHLLHDVSHEVRAPLARMQAAVGLARQQPHKADAMLDRIERETGRVDRLVEELLTLARLEAQQSDSLEHQVCIDTLLADIMDSALFEAEAQGKSITLSAPCRARVKGNPELINRAVENVVRNAIRHGASRVELNTQVDPAAQAVTIAVSDNGPGVADSDREAIFVPFFRAADGTFDGHGLGLAIAMRITKLHHARIAASNLPGGGLCVAITLPLFRQDQPCGNAPARRRGQ